MTGTDWGEDTNLFRIPGIGGGPGEILPPALLEDSSDEEEQGAMTVEWPLPDWRSDTITSFPAIRDETAPAKEQPCQCGLCGTQPEPGTDCLLSCAPGVTSRMWRTRVGNGQYDDIPALWDKAHANVHQPALKHQRQIHGALAASRHDIGAMFNRNPGLLSDTVIADTLHDLEATLAGRLAQMRRDAETEEWTAA